MSFRTAPDRIRLAASARAGDAPGGCAAPPRPPTGTAGWRAPVARRAPRGAGGVVRRSTPGGHAGRPRADRRTREVSRVNPAAPGRHRARICQRRVRTMLATPVRTNVVDAFGQG